MMTLNSFSKDPLWGIAGIILTILLLGSCRKEVRHSPDKSITSFTFLKSNGTALDTSEISVHFQNDSIFITVPLGTDLSSLTPEITITGVSISPVSGVAQNFSSPVPYTVTAQDGSTKTFIVSVSWNTPHNMVFVGSSNNSFYALDAVTGGLIWQFTSSNSFSYSSPTVWDGMVYAGCIDHNMYAFDAATGNLLWKFAADEGIESSPAVADSTVYFGSDDDYFYAVDALTGDLKWKYKTGYNVGSSPTIVNGTVYVGSDDDNVYAFDARTGNVQWTFAANGLFNASSPAVVNGILYVGCRDGNLYAIDASDGTLKWKYYADGISLEQSSPTVTNGVVYIGGWYDVNDFSRRGSVYAVNAATGALVWRSLDGLAFSSSPFVANGSLFISCDDMNLYSLDANTGIIQWKAGILPNGSSPALADGIVYAGGGGTGYIYALDAATGNEKWRFPVPNGLATSSPCIIGIDGTVYHPGISGEAF